MPKMTKKRRVEIRACNREHIRNGYVVSFIQYGCMVDHEYFGTLEEVISQITYYNDVFTTVAVLGIRHKGRTLSHGAVNEILRLVPNISPEMLL